jgi:hypothetical protein
MKNKRIFGVTLLCFAISAEAVDGEGSIKRVEFIGKNFLPHPDIVQFKIEGNFNNATCDNTWAGIRKVDNHLVSALLAARAADKVVQVYLDSNDKYFAERCVVTGIAYP